MTLHLCPLCRNELDCLDPDCIGLRYEWCDDCRMKVTRYLTSENLKHNPFDYIQ